MRRIVMTGCTSGFGKVIYDNLKEQGNFVYGVGLDGPDEKLDLVACRDAYFERLLYRLKATHGAPNTLVLNAGTTVVGPYNTCSPTEFREVLEVNLTSQFLLAAAFLEQAIPSQPISNSDLPDVRIVYTSSMSVQQVLRGSHAYCASKAGLEACMRVLSKELAADATIIGVAPAPVMDTKMMELVGKQLGQTQQQLEQHASASYPIGRTATKEEVWRLFDFAINRAPQYMTGEVLRMPGGNGIY